jgi:hypothetical protein
VIQTVITLVFAAVTFVTLHYVVGMTVLVAGLIAIVLALFGIVVFVFEGDA